MKRFITLLALPVIVATLLAPASAGPSAGGYSSDNIEWVTHVPYNGPTATGANFIKDGKSHYMVVTGWHNFVIYDISDPVAPQQIAIEPFGFKFENEDVATNGEIMLFSETLPQSNLHVYDIEDKTNPVLLATVPNAGDH